MSSAAVIAIALLIDVVCGWPDWLYRRIGHPVSWAGKLVDALEGLLNRGPRGRRIVTGAVTVVLVLVAATIPAIVIQIALPSGPVAWIVGGILAWPLIAARSLHDHVKAVAIPLESGDIEAARGQVSKIVGRDPASLDSSAISRASIESLAENSSDGVVAPVFWGVVAGLPGIVAYKMINTMDSMIGHRSERFEAFGKVAARVDDVVNLIPARLSAGLLALASGPKASKAFSVTFQDARNHRSPNAGWPESALAGALGIRLSGPRKYADHVVGEPWLNADAPDPSAGDIYRALALYKRMVALLALVLLGLALV
ncbi:MAG: adenosylcobinamide-phosphate synthase CbiB [Pseudomonadota bacterium]